MSKRMKWSLIGVAVLGIGAFVATTAAKRGKKAIEVRIDAVELRDLVAAVTASGQVQPRTKVDLAADISGRIVRLAVKEGDMVRKGQFLLEIDPQEYVAAVQRSQAALSSAKAQEAQARANLIQAERNYQRSLEIQKANAQLVAAEQLEQLKTQVDVNQALAEAAKHNVDQSEAGLRDAEQVEQDDHPRANERTRDAARRGTGRNSGAGTFNKDAATLLTISDMSVLETKVKVDETDVARISLGDSAVVQIDAFPDTTFVGKVVEISNSAVRAAATGGSTDQAIDYEVTIQLLNPPPDTRPDFSTTAKVVTDIRDKTLSIPIIALTVRENESVSDADTAVIVGRTAQKEVGKKDVEGVFIVGADNKVTFRPVKVGIAGDRYFEVLSGLTQGEKIVGGSYQAIRELKDGDVVREAEEKKPQPGSKT
jgi:HlyD family secretion protein